MARAACSARASAWGVIDQTNAPGCEGVARRLEGCRAMSSMLRRVMDAMCPASVMVLMVKWQTWLWPDSSACMQGEMRGGWRIVGTAGQVCAQASSWSSLNAGEAVGRFSFCGEKRGRGRASTASKQSWRKSWASILREAPSIMTPEWLFHLPTDDAESGSTLTRRKPHFALGHYVPM